LEHLKITDLLDIPHFGRGVQINHCVKTLLSCVHGGYVWIDNKISIDAQLIHRIATFSLEGEDPTALFMDKHEDRIVSAETMKKYGAMR